MPPRQPPHDPFTTAPLHPTTSNATHPSLRSNTSQQSLRSNASGASSRSTRQQQQGGSLFAPQPSRRPTSRSTPRIDDGSGILADSDSENEPSVQRPQRRGLRTGGVRHGSPEAKLHVQKGGGRVGKGSKVVVEEEPEIVNRGQDGGYLLGVPGVGETVGVPMMEVPRSEEEVEQDEVDKHYSAISRQYFASGASLGGRSGRKHDEELEQLRMPMMLRLREQVAERLEGERWQYESVDRFQMGM